MSSWRWRGGRAAAALAMTLPGVLTTCALLGGHVHAAEPEPMPEPAPAPLEAPLEAPSEVPGPTVEETTPEPEEDDADKVYDDRIVSVGLKLGAAINAFNSLGAAFSPELEVGVLLPPLDQSFEVFLSARWAAPSDEGDSAPDPRLPGDGVAHWAVTRNELALGLGLRYRIPLEGAFTPYLAAGMRVYLLSTEVEGDAGGEPFGKNEETGTALGFLFQLGGEYALGPGALLLELAVNGAALDQTILADTNVSSFDVYVGYRFFF